MAKKSASHGVKKRMCVNVWDRDFFYCFSEVWAMQMIREALVGSG